MKFDPIPLFEGEEYSWPMAFGFRPDIVPYLHEDGETRPCVIVVPGGGYAFVAAGEGELVADRFFDAGFQTFVLTYTTNLLSSRPLLDLPARELARAIRVIRSRAEELRVDPSRVILCGFSAGAHLCGSVCVHWDDLQDPAYEGISARPDAAILSYPVITSGEHAHRNTFQCLLGRDIYEREDKEAQELLDWYSLEKHVTASTPPCFLWHTVTDETVPVENSLLLASALRKHGVPFALHLFSEGRHGLSLADDRWAAKRYGDSRCQRQLPYLKDAVRSGQLPLPEPTRSALLNLFSEPDTVPESPREEIRVWPDLAVTWLQKTLNFQT